MKGETNKPSLEEKIIKEKKKRKKKETWNETIEKILTGITWS